MFNRFPEWYSVTEARVFNETVPFGSNVERHVDPIAYRYADDPAPEVVEGEVDGG